MTHKAGFFAQGRYTIGTLKGAKVQDGYDVVDWPTPDGKPAPTGVAASYLAINADTKNKDAAFTYWTEFLSAEGQTFRLTGGGNAVPSIKGADEVVLEDNYPTHAQTFLDMRDIGFANYAAEGARSRHCPPTSPTCSLSSTRARTTPREPSTRSRPSSRRRPANEHHHSRSNPRE